MSCARPWSLEVQQVRWWMGLYGGGSPKRHYAFGNTKMILGLDRGVLRKNTWKPTSGKKVKTAHRYVDANGKRRYQGTAQLRQTE
jgi:hypothetical protein